jgi:hypothetical protein
LGGFHDLLSNGFRRCIVPGEEPPRRAGAGDAENEEETDGQATDQQHRDQE